MHIFEAIFLGILQGITEFLPVSSSGHLKLTQYLFGYQHLEDYLLFDLVCHLGTLAAILAFFSSQIVAIFRHDWLRIKQVAVGTLPLFPLVFVIKPIKSIMNQPQYLGLFFLITALLLFLAIRWGGQERIPVKKEWKTWQDSLVIGIFQAFATLPGISRSGSTISAARLLGWDWREAMLFSFLLAIPAILGASALEIFFFVKNPPVIKSPSISCYLAGFVLSFSFGYLSLGVLTRLATRNKMMVFVWYCLFLGILCLALI